MRFERDDRRLHGFGRLQHEGACISPAPNSAPTTFMPSRVQRPSLRRSSLRVTKVKVGGSISRSPCARPCRSQAKSTRRRAMRSLSSAVLAMPPSSIVSAVSAAPNF
jgi:hypothetical protein